ncbi:MAG: hypothetical protein ACXVCP_04440 [Bdellovibrio sp.]
MKKIFLLLLASSLLVQKGFAQEHGEETTEPTAEQTSTVSVKSSRWSVTLGVLQWTEKLKIQQGALSEKDIANLNALALGVQKEMTYIHWGWNVAGLVGAGRAVGGGTTTAISYQKDKVAFSVFGLSSRVFYRFSDRINAGLTAMAFAKNIDWPLDAANQTVESGKKTNVLPLADLNIRLFRNWDFYTGIGPIVDEGTLWKVSLNYRF